MKKIMSMLLVLSMIFTMLPTPVMAEEVNTTIGGSGEIINFAPLAETEKTVSLGTSIEDLELPEALTATVRTTYAMQEDANQQTVADKVYSSEWEESMIDIPVTWTSQPGYDMYAEGEYVFTPMIEGYTVSAVLPEITVTVGTAIMGRGLVGPMSATTYNIWVGGVQVTDANKDNITGSGITGTITYDSDTKTLTLNEANITANYSDSNGNYGIYITDNLNIVLNGTNKVTAGSSNEKGSTAICVANSSLTISGDGSLTATGGSVSGITNFASCGISANQLTINGGIVVANAGTVPGNLSYGIISNIAPIFNGGTITSKGNDRAIWIAAPNLSSYPNVQVTASEDSSGSPATYYNAANIANYKYLKFEPSLIWVGGTNVVNGSSVTYWVSDGAGGITSQGASDSSYIVKYDPNTPTTPTLTLNGANLTKNHTWKANGSPTDNRSAAIYAEKALVIELADGTMNRMVGRPISGESAGAYINGKLTITGTGALYATSDTFGLYGGSATIENGVIDSVGGYTGFWSSSSLNINGGTLTAAGNNIYTKAVNSGGGAITSVYSTTTYASSTYDGNTPVSFENTYEKMSSNSYKYLRIGPVATVAHPRISPAGGTYDRAQTVTITCDTPIADIRYTTNGDEPTETSTKYTRSIPISASVLIKAKAFKGGMTSSKAVSAEFTINIAAPPSISTRLKWTGSEQTGVSGGIGYTLSGTDKATNVGSYTVTATLQSGYAWNDGSTDVKTISWSIAKADGPTAPTGLAGIVPTSNGGSDGKITGTTTDMEYANNTGFTGATGCTATETTMFDGGTTWYVRVKENANYNAGAYATVTIPTYSPDALTGTATISSTAPRIGDTLTASLTGGNNTGTLSYVWKAAGTQVGTGISYTVAVADLDKAITLEISSSTETGIITSIATATVLKKAAPSAPEAPTLVSKTNNSITLTAKVGYQFSKDGTIWQTSNVFSGLTASTAYTFYQRVAETTDTEASTASMGLSVTTNSNNASSGSGGGRSSDKDSSSDSSKSSADNSSIVIVTPPSPDKPNSPTQGEIKVDGKVDENRNATVNITSKNVTDVFDKALADAKKNGNEQNGITMILHVNTGGKTFSNVTVNLPKTVQDIIIAKKIVNTIVVVDNPDIKIGMDLATVGEINRQANSDVNITAAPTDSSKLTGDAKRAIGSRPVFNLKVNYGSSKQVQSFGAGIVSVTIPYILGANEKAENIFAVYIDGNGKVHWLTGSVYDSVEKVLRFSTSHFSTYGVGYKEEAPVFTDITNHWAKEDIEFVVSRGLLRGTSESTFSPNTAMTRGMFVTALGRAANADVSNYKQSNFSDVKDDDYYMGYIEWAKENGIVNGTTDGKFLPDASITREQMSVIMSNYAKNIGFTLPSTHTENTFADSDKISAYAKDAVEQMQMAGVLDGKNGNLFDPQGTATRAVASAVLRRFVELTISSDTK